MKIGILTFHWATNYGAILQTFALQTYLESIGIEVCIINYKPVKYDFSLINFLSPRNIYSYIKSPFNIKKYIINYKKEKELEKFRNDFLHLTKRFNSLDELKKNSPECDIYISGSDQIFNSSFVLNGEGKGKKTTTYFLDFGNKNVIRIGYAVSFGTENYPQNAMSVVTPLIKNFNFIGVRENTGINILKSINYYKTKVLPDPTLLLNSFDYINKIKLKDNISQQDYYFVYILRDNLINNIKSIVGKIKVADTNNEYSIQQWLNNLRNSNGMITNSYHGLIFSLLFHIPFVVLVKEGEGMNDRFNTLLNKLNLLDRVISYKCLERTIDIFAKSIDWVKVDNSINDISSIGKEFLNNL